MYMHKVLICAVLVISCPLILADRFSKPASPEDIKNVYYSVFPNGGNLPEGSGNARQGKPLYEQHCSACHGLNGEGTLADKLVGGRGTLTSETPIKTLGSYWPYATTIFDYTRRAMPYNAPMSLSNENYYAITAYLLNMNEIISANAIMDRNSLPEVQMPNRNGFINAYPKWPEKYDLVK